MSAWWRSLRRSVLWQLFVVLVVASAMIDLVVWRSFHHALEGHAHHQMIDKGVQQYLHYLAADISAAHDPQARAAELAQQLDIALRIESPVWNWSSEPIQEPPKHGGFFHPPGPPPMMHRMSVDFPFGSGTARLSMFPPHGAPPPMQPDVQALVHLLVTLSIILLLSYLLMRAWIFYPLRALALAVGELGKGNLRHRVPQSSGSELGRLGEAFNTMADKVNEMVVSKEQLLIDVSHELRSPLARARVALEFVGDAEPRRQIAEDIDEVDRMVGQILEGARLDAGAAQLERTPTDLVAEARTLADRFLALGRTVVVTGATDVKPIPVDGERLRTVLRNLVENAAKYSAPPAPIEIRFEDAATALCVKVIDHGIGISEAEQAKVFEPFYRVDKSRTRATGGFGLGLSLCAKIIRAHGGTIRLQSVEGQGTTVAVELPR